MQKQVRREAIRREPVLCDFNKVELQVPRLRLIKLLWKKHYLDHDEVIFLKALLWQAEAANHKILHVISVAEKALLKATNTSYT
jgi:hypothetical protein